MSDDGCPIEFINSKFNVFQVIQLYLINDIYENHEAIYSILYNIINDIKLTINLKELNQHLNGQKPKSDLLIDIIVNKLGELKNTIRHKNSETSKYRNKQFESVESSSAESNTYSPPKNKQTYRLCSSSLKPKPQFKKKDYIKKCGDADSENFQIFNLQKRKRPRSVSTSATRDKDHTVTISPKDFFEGKIPRIRHESVSSVTTEDSANILTGSKDKDEIDLNVGEVIFEPWTEEIFEVKDASTPVNKNIKVTDPPVRGGRKNSNPKRLLPSMLKKTRKTPHTVLRRSPRKQPAATPNKEKVIVIEESPVTKTIGLISSDFRSKAAMSHSRRKLELGEPETMDMGSALIDSEETDPEDDIPLVNLQPVLANSNVIKSLMEPSKKLKKKREEIFVISSVIKPPSEINRRFRRSPVKSPKGLNERYSATSMAISQMLNPDYVPPAADDEIEIPVEPEAEVDAEVEMEADETPRKECAVVPINLSQSMSSENSDVPALEEIENESLAVPLQDTDDELEDDEEAQQLIRDARKLNRIKSPKFTTPKKNRNSSPTKLLRKTPVKNPSPNKSALMKITTPKKSSSLQPPTTPLRSSPRKSSRVSPTKISGEKVDENKNERRRKKKKGKKKLNLRALAATGTQVILSKHECVEEESMVESDDLGAAISQSSLTDIDQNLSVPSQTNSTPKKVQKIQTGEPRKPTRISSRIRKSREEVTKKQPKVNIKRKTNRRT